MITRLLFGLTLTLTTLIVAFWLAWVILTPANFAYSLAYDNLAIDSHINHFGPLNQFKDGFAQTDKQQHVALFRAIVTAVNDAGKGLADIRYTLPNGTSETLLREPEVVHLQDVANLVQGFKYTAWISCGLLLASLWMMKLTTWAPPSLKQIAVGGIVILVLIIFVMLLLGPTYVFYWLHIKIFPDDHQWFFYYQESLMTTLMKAPDLFGFIAVIWASLALMLFALMQWLLHRWHNNQRLNR